MQYLVLIIAITILEKKCCNAIIYKKDKNNKTENAQGYNLRAKINGFKI
jgi:hypothetical protein